VDCGEQMDVGGALMQIQNVRTSNVACAVSCLSSRVIMLTDRAALSRALLFVCLSVSVCLSNARAVSKHFYISNFFYMIRANF